MAAYKFWSDHAQRDFEEALADRGAVYRTTDTYCVVVPGDDYDELAQSMNGEKVDE